MAQPREGYFWDVMEGRAPAPGATALLGFKMLENGGYVPEWLNLGREIEIDLEALALIDRNHQEYCDNSKTPSDWRAAGPALDRLRQSYEKKAREIRKKQDRFNHDAPGIRSQRPAIWVEYHLERLTEREHASGRLSNR